MRSALLFAALAAGTAFGYVPSDWRLCAPDGGLNADAADGRVTLTLAGRGFACGGDGYVSARLPLLARGSIDFDVKIDAPLSGRTVGAFLSFYGVTVFWHDSCGDWRAYFPDPNAKREMAFDIEPVSHRRISRFKNGVWHHVRIAFDAPSDRIEYFIDDMSDPALIVGDRSVWGAAEFMGGELRIGGMGGSRGGICSFKGIEFAERRDEAKAVERTETLVFNGMGGDFYGVHELLPKENARLYTVDTTRSMYLPLNSLKYAKLPGRDTVKRACRIVLADAPAGPDGALPDFVLADIVEAVSDGAELVVLGGFFSLGKGEYAGTPLAKILPESVSDLKPFDASPDGPRIDERKVGRGIVKVFSGMKFSSSVKETRERFRPYAARLFGLR